VCGVHGNRRELRSPQPKLSPSFSSHGHHRLNIASFTINTHHPDIFITTQWLHQRKASRSVAPFAQQLDFLFASPPVVAVAETLSYPSQANPPSSSFACAFSHVRIWWLRTVMDSATRAFHVTITPLSPLTFDNSILTFFLIIAL
jgi:hypothetical protein